jgi:hypothetical protein
MTVRFLNGIGEGLELGFIDAVPAAYTDPEHIIEVKPDLVHGRILSVFGLPILLLFDTINQQKGV